MCEMASFIVTQGRLLWSTKTNRHSEILKENNLPDRSDSPDFVKVELVPVDKNYSLPLADWVFRVDQKYLPDWFNAKVEEAACREALVEWSKHYIHREEKIKLVDYPGIFINCQVDEVKVSYGYVWFYDNSTCTTNSSTGGDVRFCGTSTCTTNSSTGGDVRFYDNSTCTTNNSTGGYVWFCGTSTCTTNSSTGGHVWFCGTSTCTTNSSTGGEVWFCGTSTCTTNSSTGGYVGFYGTSTCTTNSSTGGDVRFYDNSTCQKDNGR